MRIAICGDDRRLNCLRDMLEGHELVPDASEAELVITKWPAQTGIGGNAALVTFGPENGPEWAADLLLDEVYQHDIAWMTAEGAISAAMRETDTALCGARCMVVGWGRIGRALTERLTALGAHVTVLSRRKESFVKISAAGGDGALTQDICGRIPGMKYIFSTPPEMTVDEDALRRADKDALVIDLASPPYGVDIEAAARLGIKAWREPGLPGRYCPVNAAQAIYDALLRHGLLKGGR